MEDLDRRATLAKRFLGYSEAKKRLELLEVEIARSDLWDDLETAKSITTEYNATRDDIEIVDNLFRQIADANVYIELIKEEGGELLVDELSKITHQLNSQLQNLEIRSLLSGEHDEQDAVAEIHAGAGGTDAQDWAEMMLRMYQRWAERRGFDFEIDEITEGSQAGILSVTFIIRGRFAYGLLSTERGVHRMVRMSPFDSAHRRHTSFASFDVIPLLDDPGEVSIDESELRIDTYRSSGAGGQHVNKTDSAVRITHLPTGIAVACQNERSQHQNKAKAMQILASKLAELERVQHQEKLNAISGPQSEVAWGSQIRSYVLAPYQLVKDLRTSFEVGNVAGVLDGDLDPLIESFLSWRRSENSQ
ncbi:MAG: peptide chain release factor 2 [Acidimicrobiales bacterium]|nr:peptide chain release factor 2 [Acidimicrobiales bacterium]